jgi:uncharacterized protein YukE
MSDLKADTQRIRECSDALQRIYDEFTNRANPADGYTQAELGSSLITGAFDDFASNWKVHRQDLTDKLRTLGTITQQAADTYDGVDTSLANALRTQDAAAAHAGPPR